MDLFDYLEAVAGKDKEAVEELVSLAVDEAIPLSQLKQQFQFIVHEHQDCAGCQVEIDFLLWGAMHGDIRLTEKSIAVIEGVYDPPRRMGLFKEAVARIYKREIPGSLGMVFAHHQAFLSLLPSYVTELNSLVEYLPLIRSLGPYKKRRDLWLWNMSNTASPLFFLSVVFFLAKRSGVEISETLCDFLSLLSLKLQPNQPNLNGAKKQLDLLGEGLCFLIQENGTKGREILKRLMESETFLDELPHVCALMEKESLYCALGLEKEKEDQGSGKRKKM